MFSGGARDTSCMQRNKNCFLEKMRIWMHCTVAGKCFQIQTYVYSCYSYIKLKKETYLHHVVHVLVWGEFKNIGMKGLCNWFFAAWYMWYMWYMWYVVLCYYDYGLCSEIWISVQFHLWREVRIHVHVCICAVSTDCNPCSIQCKPMHYSDHPWNKTTPELRPLLSCLLDGHAPVLYCFRT